MQNEKRILFFDGVCHLCNGLVDYLLRKDSSKELCFAPLQGPTAAAWFSREERTALESVVYLDQGVTYVRSSAVVRVLASLGGFYRLCIVLLVIPAPLRDVVYKWVAKNRYAWFGQREVCRLPTPEERGRLLE